MTNGLTRLWQKLALMESYVLSLHTHQTQAFLISNSSVQPIWQQDELSNNE
jgi:hypothetical protein